MVLTKIWLLITVINYLIKYNSFFKIVILAIIVLLQSGKAESASQIISGGNLDLFNKRKERGSELFISRLTFALGMIFFVAALVMDLI